MQTDSTSSTSPLYASDLAGKADLRDGLAAPGGFCFEAWLQPPALAEQELDRRGELAARQAPVPEQTFRIEGEGAVVRRRNAPDQDAVLLVGEPCVVGVEGEARWTLRDGVREVGRVQAESPGLEGDLRDR